MTDAASDGTGGSARDPSAAERERLIPFGVRADTGETPPLLTEADLNRIAPAPRAQPISRWWRRSRMPPI